MKKLLRRMGDWWFCGFLDSHDDSVSFVQSEWNFAYYVDWEYTCCGRCGKVLRRSQAPMW